jgi:Fe-S-cluster containining protein
MTCGNKCGNGWCCRGFFFNLQAERGPIMLALKRGYKVYRLKKEFVDGFIGHDTSCTCSELSLEGRCKIHDTKPDICKNFPDMNQVHILTDLCPLEGPLIFKISMTEEVTEANLEEQLDDYFDRCRL